MALSTSPSKGAVPLSEIEAISYVWHLVGEWEYLSESWALRYSSVLLGGASSLTGVYINNYYRRKLKLGRLGHFSSLIPIVFLPGMASGFFHRQSIATTMLLKPNVCSVCLETKSAAIQLGYGCIYPMLLGPTAALLFAHRYATYRLPSIKDSPLELIQLFKKISKPLFNNLFVIGLLHLIASSTLTYFELENSIAIYNRIQEIEKNIDTNNN